MQISYILIIAALVFSLMLYPNGLILNAATDWRPIWSWEFYVLVLIFTTFLIVIPLLYFQLKVYYSYKTPLFREKWRYFLIGTTMNSFLSLGAFTYIFWDNALYRTIWSVVSLLIVLTSILIYSIVAQDIQKLLSKEIN
ncbi:MAG: hypothetical protein EU533_04445 [Promethearchaeota archaeon]|nr:MAG: hypothetical protein EU533_04445 [Candidatus Lokiarchaeota archaeon]